MCHYLADHILLLQEELRAYADQAATDLGAQEDLQKRVAAQAAGLTEADQALNAAKVGQLFPA